MKNIKYSKRCSPTLLNTTVEALNEAQRETVRKMGFGGLLQLNCGQMNLDFCRKLVERFDTRNMQLIIGETSVHVTPHDVHSVLGVPIGREEFDLENNVKLVNSLTNFKGKTNTELRNFIKKGSSGNPFRRAFILLALGTFLCPTTKVVASPKLLQTVDDVSDPHKFNWGKLVLDWLVLAIKKYKRGKNKSINGCLFFLQIFYFHKCPIVSMNVGADKPIIKNWVKEKISQRIAYERKQGLLSMEEADPLWLREQLKHEISRGVFKQMMEEILKPLDRKIIDLSTPCNRCSCQIGAEDEDEDEGDWNEDENEDEDEGDRNGDGDEDEGDRNEDEDEGDRNEDGDEVRNDDLQEKKQVEEEVYEDEERIEDQREKKQMDECEAESDYAEEDNDESEDVEHQMEECEAEREEEKQDNNGDEGRNEDHKQVEEEESAKKGEAEVKEKHTSGRKRGNAEAEGSSNGAIKVYKRRRKENIDTQDLVSGEKPCIEQNFFLCHQCLEIVKMSKGVRCTSCKKRGFCQSCLQTWYPKSEECGNDVQTCPLCRGNCNCNACLRSNSVKKKDKTNEDKGIEVEHSLYVLEKLLPCLEKLDQEQMSDANRQGLGSITIEMADHYQDQRVYCDKCKTSIFDYHRTCTKCEFDICLRCWSEIHNGTGADAVESLAAAKPEGRKRNTCSHSLELKRMLPRQNYISELILKAENVAKEIKCLNEKKAPNNVCCQNTNDICRYRAVQEKSDLAHFQLHWRKGHPVIVSNVLESTSGLSWDPEVMVRALCDKSNDTTKNTSDVEVIDCLNWRQVHVSFPEFFSGYKKGSKKQMLKLKDWPSFDFLHNLLPRHCAEFISSLPHKEYTDPLAGYLNLAAKWPNESQKPDMGPKLYIAYGFPHELGRGDSVSTLHCDMSDAVNVMTHVAEVKLGSEDIAVTGSSMQGTMGGALWDIFRREDVEKLKEYLTENSKEFKSVKGNSINQVTHAIHDQTFYLTEEHKKKLWDKCGIKPWTFIQNLGDAVLIPAGCPHQVRNLKPCIKVALDFVSPENVDQCIRLTEEFRNLPKNHSFSEDKLQVKRMIIHAMVDVVEKLEKHLHEA